MLVLNDRGLIFDARSRPTDERVNCFTSLFRSRQGVLIAGFQIGSAKHSPNSTLRLCRSDDHGRTWRELPTRLETTLDGTPGSLAGAEIVENANGQWLLFTTWFDRSDPARPLFDPVTEGILHSRQLKAVSTDQGVTWSGWTTIATPGLTGTAICGPPLSWPDGRVAFAFESFKEYDDPTPAKHAAWLLSSVDGGRTFDKLHLVGQNPDLPVYYWDQRLRPAGPGGEYVGLFWTHDLAQQRDLPVHVKWGSLDDQVATQAVSATAPASLCGKRPRSLPADTRISGQIAAPWVLDDGGLLAFVVDRGQPGTMTLWYSPDRGKTWPAADRLVVYAHDERAMLSQGAENIDFKQYWEDMGKWTFGHPAIVQVSPTQLLLAFYAGIPNCLSIHWALVNIN